MDEATKEEFRRRVMERGEKIQEISDDVIDQLMAIEDSQVERLLALAMEVMPEIFDEDKEAEELAMQTRKSVVEAISNLTSHRLLSFNGIKLPAFIEKLITGEDSGEGCPAEECPDNVNGMCIKGNKGGDA